MNGSTSGPDLFNRLADEFAERYRRGERPPLSEYADKYPEFADEIRELFPAMVAIEQFGTGADGATGPVSAQQEAAGPIPERLGDYRIVREIARGGMGIVYEAVQESLGRHVALKVLPQHRLSDPEQLERFRRESRAAAMLHHSNIVPVFGVGECEGVHHYAMQYIQGQSLDDVLREVRRLRGVKPAVPAPSQVRGHDPGLAESVAIDLVSGRFAGQTGAPGETESVTAPHPPPPGELPATTADGEGPGQSFSASSIVSESGSLYYRSVARISLQAAEAIAYAHQHKVVHRDLKPSNLLLDLQGTVWVTDFGLAKAEGTDALTHTGDIVGTLRYMAPERFRGEADARSDVYALGLTLYEMLALEPAFAADHRARLIDKILHAEPPKPRQLDPRIPRDLETITLKAMAREPSDRYRTALELAEDLRRYLADRPILARRVGPLERAWRWSKRNPFLASASVAVAAALMAMVVMSLKYAREQSNANQVNQALAGKLVKSLAESNRLLAARNFDRGQAAFEKGQIGPGLLWMIESWRSAVDACDTAWQHVARANLAAWRVHYPRLKAVLSHKMPVHRAAFSPDSRTVISGSVDGTAQLWDAHSGKRIGSPMQQGAGWIQLGFSPDGKTVWSCSQGNTARLWDTTTGEPLRLLVLPPQVHIMAAAIQQAGKIVLAGTEDGFKILRLWDADSGKPIGPPLTHRGYNSAFSPDGRMILALSDDGTVGIRDVATGQPIGRPLERLGNFRSASFSPDCKSIVTGGEDGTAQLWDAATGKSLGPPTRHESQVRAVAISPDGKTVLTGCQDKGARLWDAATGQFIGLLEHQGGVTAVVFSPDGKTILTGSLDGTVRLWDADPGRPVGDVWEIPGTDTFPPNEGLSPDGKVLISRGWSSVQLWNTTTRQPIGARLPQPSGNWQVLFSSDGKVLLTTEFDQTARLWDATTGVALSPPLPIPSELDGQRLSPDGKALLFVGKDQAVRICDGATGSVRGRTPALGGIPNGLEFTPDGKTFFTGLDNGEGRLWDALTFTPLGEPFQLHSGAISDSLFSRDGKLLLIMYEDGSCWLWDVASRKLLIPLLGHQAPVGGEAFSPDGHAIATGSDDKTVRIWDIATGQPIGPVLRHHGPVLLVAFLDDGKTLFTRSMGWESRLFRIPPDLPDELVRVATWVEVITGLRLDQQQGLIQVLDNASWLEGREHLMRLGGPPDTGPEQRLDPILFGPDPTARARIFMERKQWDAAEAAFDEAMRARPFNIAIIVERGNLYAHRGLWSEAAAYYARAVKQYPDLARLHEQLAVTRLLAGDLPGYRAACAGMLERFRTDDDISAMHVAYACSLAPEAVTDLPGWIQFSEWYTRWAPSGNRGAGAVLFRAGRLEEALQRFAQAHKVVPPRAWDWLFLGMIHSRLGHTSEAQRSLQQAEQWIIEADNAPAGTEKEGPHWSNLTERPLVLLLRREAEASIRCDSNFPIDPFAR